LEGLLGKTAEFFNTKRVLLLKWTTPMALSSEFSLHASFNSCKINENKNRAKQKKSREKQNKRQHYKCTFWLTSFHLQHHWKTK